MEFLKQPSPMCMAGDLSSNWKKFKNNYSLYATASGCTARDAEVQAADLLHCIGEEAREIMDTLGLTADEMKKPETILAKFEEYFVPKANTSVERHKFNTKVQQSGENFDTFLNELKKIAANCNFGELKDELIKDRIICGIADRRVKDRLLRESGLDLAKAVQFCRAAEQTEVQMKQLNYAGNSPEVNVATLHQHSNRNQTSNSTRNRNKGRWNPQAEKRTTHEAAASAATNKDMPMAWPMAGNTRGQRAKNCSRCGYVHQPRKCPAYGATCRKCGKANHFEKNVPK